MVSQSSNFDELAGDAADLVRRWLKNAASLPLEADTDRLRAILTDPNGSAFLIGLLDGVVRPEDLFAAGYNLQRTAPLVPGSLPAHTRLAVRLAGVLGPVVPGVVIPLTRRWLRRVLSPLILDASSEALTPAIEHLSQGGVRLAVSLVGAEPAGESEALDNLEDIRTILERDDVQEVSIHAARFASRLAPWSFEESVGRLVDRLGPLFEYADLHTKVVILETDRYRDLELTVAVFRGLLDQQKFQRLKAGIVLQAYLPDAMTALQSLTRWATERRAGGGAPITVHLVKGANLALERVDAATHGIPAATLETKQAVDANYMRMLDWALTAQNVHSVRIAVATQNLFDVAFAWLLAVRRGVEERVRFAGILGIADNQLQAVHTTVGDVHLAAPLAYPDRFADAVPYLIRRIAQLIDEEGFASLALSPFADLFEREKLRFFTSAAQASAEPAGGTVPARRQDRSTQWQNASASDFVHPAAPPEDEALDAGLTGVVLGLQRGSIEPGGVLAAFRNEQNTDHTLPANRGWAHRVLARVPASDLGEASASAALVADEGILDQVIASVVAHGEQWGARTGFQRGAVLDRAAIALAANRDRLIEVIASETGMTISEADSEVSAAVDYAGYYAARARELDTVQGARFVPDALTVVSVRRPAPAAVPASGVLASLAAGSAAILLPSPQAARSAAVLAEALWEAGIPRQLLALVDLSGDESLLRRLLVDRRVDRLILTADHDTALRYHDRRRDLPLIADTGGTSAIIVTANADYDQAVQDIVSSAFRFAGQGEASASLAILVGSVGSSERFAGRLADAVTSLHVGYPDDPASEIGPLIAPATGKQLHSLTMLGGGEDWLVEPQQRDSDGRLWSPGVRTGVQPGSYFHLTEFHTPVLGILRARTLEQAIRYVNAAETGASVGLESLDAGELAQVLDTLETGSLFVNRPVTGALVGRHPGGGWKRSALGAGAKTGGPNSLIGLGSWQPDESRSSKSLHLRGLDPWVSELIESGQSSMDYPAFDLVRRSALSDAIAWAGDFGQVSDLASLGVERNLLRYRPVPVTVRLAEGGALPHLLRILAAGTLARSALTVSVPAELPAGISVVLAAHDVPVGVQSDADWLAALAVGATARIRLIDGDRDAAAVALGAKLDVAVYAGAVTPSGRVELLPFLREQTISITAHRYGIPDDYSQAVID